MIRTSFTTHSSSSTEAALAIWHAGRSGAGDSPTPDRIDRVREKLADPWAHLALATQEDVAVGMALVEPFRAQPGGSVIVDRGHVSMVFVSPPAQGSGVGRALMTHLLGCGNWTSLSLWTRHANERAQRLYRASGFMPTGELGRTPSGQTTERWQR